MNQYYLLFEYKSMSIVHIVKLNYWTSIFSTLKCIDKQSSAVYITSTFQA